MGNNSVQAAEALFERLSPEEGALLASLSYRVGLYISYCDVTGGWEAQEKEFQTLNNILREYSEDYCKSEFAQKILMETLAQRTQWPSWSQDMPSVLTQCTEALAMLEGKLTAKELESVKEVLIEIALSVAMAFREESRDGAVADQPSPYGRVSSVLKKIMGGKAERDPLSHLSISLDERAALTRLCKAMNYTLQR